MRVAFAVQGATQRRPQVGAAEDWAPAPSDDGEEVAGAGEVGPAVAHSDYLGDAAA